MNNNELKSLIKSGLDWLANGVQSNKHVNIAKWKVIYLGTECLSHNYGMEGLSLGNQFFWKQWELMVDNAMYMSFWCDDVADRSNGIPDLFKDGDSQ